MTLARPGRDSKIWDSSPTSDSSPATCSAARRSPGPELSPGLVVSIRIRSRQMPTTSSAAVTFWFSVWLSVTLVSSHLPGCLNRCGPGAGAGEYDGRLAVRPQVCYRDPAEAVTLTAHVRVAE